MGREISSLRTRCISFVYIKTTKIRKKRFALSISFSTFRINRRVATNVLGSRLFLADSPETDLSRAFFFREHFRRQPSHPLQDFYDSPDMHIASEQTFTKNDDSKLFQYWLFGR
jgi:hypothetical protein